MRLLQASLRKPWFSIACCAMLLAGAASAASDAAQENGGVRGTAVSTDGAPIAGAVITFTGRSLARSTRTQSDGGFRIADLPPGPYTVSAFAGGYARLEARTVQVPAGVTIAIQLTLSAANSSSLIVIGNVRVNGSDALSTASAPSVTVGAQTASARGYDRVSDMIAGELSTTVLHPLGAGANAPAPVALRGGDPTETLVDVDGHQVNNGNSGDFDLSLLDPADFQNVQVVYGIAPSSLIGPDTLGGAINIRTLEPTTTPASLVRVSGGSYGTFAETAQATGTDHQFGYAFSLRHVASDGEVDGQPVPQSGGGTVVVGSGLLGSTGLAKLRYSLGTSGGYVGVTVRDQSVYRDLSAALTSLDGSAYDASPGSSLRSYNIGYGLDAQLALSKTLQATFSHLTTLVSQSVSGPAADTSPYLYNDRDLIADDTLELDQQVKRAVISLKVNERTERLTTAFVAGVATDQSAGRRAALFAEGLAHDSAAASPPRLELGQTQRSAALRYALDPTPQLHYTLAAYFSDFSTFGSSFDPRFGFVWTPNGSSALRFSLGTTFQPPQLTELIVPPQLPPPVDGYSSIGNPHLKPDHATEYDLGYEHLFGGPSNSTHVAIDLYRTNIRTPSTRYVSPTPCIDENDDPATCLSYPVNVGAAVYQGLEFRADRALSRETSVHFRYGIDSAVVADIPLRLQNGTVVANEQSLGVPLHKAALTLERTNDRGVAWHVGAVYEGWYNELNRPPFATLEAGLTWRCNGFDAGLEGRNLSNAYADRFTHVGAGVPYAGIGGKIPTDAYALPARTIVFLLTRRM